MKSTVSAQDFWCITLDKDNRECVWKHDDKEISHHLMIEQVVLGLNCKDNCMVEATSCLASGEERSTMICQLIPSAVPNCKLSLCFEQVKLKLAAGDGPVYLTGTHSQETKEEADSESVEEYTESELMQQEKLNKQRHQILELQETVQKLETEVKNLKNRCTNTVTSGQGKGNDEDSQGKYRALSQRLDKEKLKSQRLEILELQRTVKEMEQEMKLMKCNYSGDKENTTPQLTDQEYCDSQNWEISQLKRKVREMEDGMRSSKSACTVDKENRDSQLVDWEYCNDENWELSQLKRKVREMEDEMRPSKSTCTGTQLDYNRHGPAFPVYRKRKDLALINSDTELEEVFYSTLKAAGFPQNNDYGAKPCLDMLNCLLVKAGILPQEDQSLLEMLPVDIGRRVEGQKYLDVRTTDTIVKVVSTYVARDRRSVRRCLCDKLRHLRTLKKECYDSSVQYLVSVYGNY